MTFPIHQITFVTTDALQLPQIHVVLPDGCDIRVPSQLARMGYAKQTRQIAHGTTQSFWCKNLQKQTDVVTEMHSLTRIFGVIMFPTEKTNARIDLLDS